tara:strand:+ start:1542 stop:2015 length:474 start_codon:yes stop_codon:yes gene_type:complete
MAWEKLVSIELTGTGDLIDTGTFDAKEKLFVEYYINASGSAGTNLRVNSDASGNYAYRFSSNGQADTTLTTQGIVELRVLYGNSFGTMNIINKSAQAKLFIIHEVAQNTASASNAPQRQQNVTKWVDTSAQITSLQLSNDGGGDFAAGSTITIWGTD